MMAGREIQLQELTEKAGITMANLFILKMIKTYAVRFSTWELFARRLIVSPEIY